MTDDQFLDAPDWLLRGWSEADRDEIDRAFDAATESLGGNIGRIGELLRAFAGSEPLLDVLDQIATIEARSGGRVDPQGLWSR